MDETLPHAVTEESPAETPAAPTTPAGTLAAPVSAPAPVPLPSAVPSRRGQSRGLGALYMLAVAVAVGGSAFSVGRLTAPAGTAAGGGNAAAQAAGRGQFGPTGSFQPGAMGGFPMMGGSSTITGTVVSLDGTTLTLKTSSGSTVEITVGGSTAYHAQAAATSSDVTAGATVQVQLSGGARAGLGGTSSGGSTGQGGAVPNASALPARPAPRGTPVGAGGQVTGGQASLTATDVTIVTP